MAATFHCSGPAFNSNGRRSCVLRRPCTPRPMSGQVFGFVSGSIFGFAHIWEVCLLATMVNNDKIFGRGFITPLDEKELEASASCMI